MSDLRKYSRIKTTYYQSTGQIRYDDFNAYNSKTIIDAIDRVLAQQYGFADEETDFIIIYDLKYWMGKKEL
jgi:hypothetical protein